MMEQKITATNARIHFGAVMRQVMEEGEPVIVERAGQPQVVIMSVDAYEKMKVAQQQVGWQETLAQAIHVGARIKARRDGQPLTPPEDVVGQIREERDAHLDDLR
jgi:prevent-host-death family protein